MKFIAPFCWGVAYHEYSTPFTDSFQPQAKLQMFQQVNKEVHDRESAYSNPPIRQPTVPGLFMCNAEV